MEITDDIRRAVRLADCEEDGHQWDFNSLIQPESAEPGSRRRHGALKLKVEGPDPDTLPHLVCRHCGFAYILVPAGGMSYEEAEAAVYALLRADTGIAREITRVRARRSEADRKPEPEPKPGKEPKGQVR